MKFLTYTRYCELELDALEDVHRQGCKDRRSSESNRGRECGTEKVSSDFFHCERPKTSSYTMSIIPWLLKEYPCGESGVARPEGRIEIHGHVESSISRRPMRLLRTSPPTRPRFALRFTMSLR